jgi:hypothetical protein
MLSRLRKKLAVGRQSSGCRIVGACVGGRLVGAGGIRL